MEFSVGGVLVSEETRTRKQSLDETWRALSLSYEKRHSAGNTVSNSVSGEAGDIRVPIHMLFMLFMSHHRASVPTALPASCLTLILID